MICNDLETLRVEMWKRVDLSAPKLVLYFLGLGLELAVVFSLCVTVKSETRDMSSARGFCGAPKVFWF